MVQVLRTMAEVATNETLTQLIAFVKDSLDDTRFLWDSEQWKSKLLSLVDVSGKESALRLFSFLTFTCRGGRYSH